MHEGRHQDMPLTPLSKNRWFVRGGADQMGEGCGRIPTERSRPTATTSPCDASPWSSSRRPLPARGSSSRGTSGCCPRCPDDGGREQYPHLREPEDPEELATDVDEATLQHDVHALDDLTPAVGDAP